MSINLIKKHSSSPFQLQRSIVDQGGSGGAYEEGGFNPKATYSNDAANEAIASMGKTIGDAIRNRKPEDPVEAGEAKQKRLQKRGDRLVQKSANSNNDNQVKRLDKRIERIAGKIEKTKAEVAAAKERQNPTVKSDLKDGEKI